MLFKDVYWLNDCAIDWVNGYKQIMVYDIAMIIAIVYIKTEM